VVVSKDASAGQFRDCRGGNGAYGGLWTENIVSAISRDLLAAALLRLERAGYRVGLHVHDEIIAEVPIGFGSTEEFTRLMITPPSWALGLPIAAQAWSGSRFSKS
jgi:DNA polymerase bacteriophage-type